MKGRIFTSPEEFARAILRGQGVPLAKQPDDELPEDDDDLNGEDDDGDDLEDSFEDDEDDYDDD